MNTSSVLLVPGMSSKSGALVATDCDDPDEHAADERARQARHAAEHGRRERRDEVRRRHDPRPEAAAVGHGDERGEPAEQGGQDPRERRQPAHADADQLRRRRLLAGADDRQAEVGAGEEQPEQRRRARPGWRSASSRWSETCTPSSSTRSTRSKPLAIGLPWAPANQISMPMASRATPAVATSSVTRGALNSGRTIDALGQEAHQRGGDERAEERQPVVGLEVEQVQGVQGDGAELALGEVEDAARLVDEHEAEGDHPVGRPGGHPDDERRVLARGDQHDDERDGDERHRPAGRAARRADPSSGGPATNSAAVDELLDVAVGLQQVGAGAAEVVLDACTRSGG